MKYKAMLIDDEVLAIKRLEKLLSAFDEDLEIVSRATNGEDAVMMIDELKPDVIFLDIQMPELSGFQVLERIKHQPFVIFCTAYDEYALRAFEANSIDYLLKPVDIRRLEKTIAKLKNFRKETLEEFHDQLRFMLNTVKRPAQRIQVRKGDRIKLLDPENIYFFLSDEKYTRVNTFDNYYLIDKSLNSLEKELEDHFIRIHRKVIINLNHMDEIIKMFKGSFNVKMRDKSQTELPVSRYSRHKLGL